MAGIYIHIPFCKKACHYCAFHFSTNLSRMTQMVDALKAELVMRAPFLDHKTIKTIYLGGGTPSLLAPAQIQELLDTISTHYQLEETLEITLEANPDDLSSEYLKALKADSLVNRLSIGVQSFHDEDLLFMNRAHTARHAHEAIQAAKTAGFEHLSIDLIFGNPTTSSSMWITNIDTALSYDIPHLSLYALTVEEKTALASFIDKKHVPAIRDNLMEEQFLYNVEHLNNDTWEQYEISNFAKKGYRSEHNQSYWHRINYLGIGPSAHSYSRGIRYQNVSNNAQYIKQINTGELFMIEDRLSKTDQFNELIMTSLRLIEGLPVSAIDDFSDLVKEDFYSTLADDIKHGLVKKQAEHYILTKKGKLFADRIASDLFITN